MLVIAPTRTENRTTLPVDHVNSVVSAIGTEYYDHVCFKFFEAPFDVDHWALFHYRGDASVSCIATDSRVHGMAAKESISRFVGRAYTSDPSLIALKSRRLPPTCTVKVEIGDIRDRYYRTCFELTGVRERLSFLSRTGSELYQLSIFRSARRDTFTREDMENFTTCASLILATSLKHRMFQRAAVGIPEHLNLEAIEELLKYLPGELSKREREVCARVVAGMTIEGTALDLDIQRTSVVTYRQRAYDKLGISRQTQLVAMFNNVRADAPAEPRLAS